MSKKAKQAKKTPEQVELEENLKTSYFNKALEEPLPWLKLDSAILDDGDLQYLRDEHGKAICWDFVALICLLAKRKGHVIDVSSPAKWKRLSAYLEQYDVDETKNFIFLLAEYRLIDPHFLEEGLIINNRVMRTAEDYAKNTANARFRAWCRYEKDKVE